ncbi:hypothetical protein EYF80_048165 [Liparis tanakae]|uniref:Uncharacterized protein n=1 Tax=Liparis tanakae TaxID=230148 RepID=A0A4Z2FK99_9TELE|nr:hypothetical protein EYF80_048165 [Liparis tanakae]
MLLRAVGTSIFAVPPHLQSGPPQVFTVLPGQRHRGRGVSPVEAAPIPPLVLRLGDVADPVLAVAASRCLLSGEDLRRLVDSTFVSVLRVVSGSLFDVRLGSGGWSGGRSRSLLSSLNKGSIPCPPLRSLLSLLSIRSPLLSPLSLESRLMAVTGSTLLQPWRRVWDDLLSPGSLDFRPLAFFFSMFLPVVNRLVSSSSGLVGVRERPVDTFCMEPWSRPAPS